MSGDDGYLKDFLSGHAVPPEDIAHFSAIEWTNKYLQDPSYLAVATFARILKPTGEDFFFSRTINTPVTIPHYISLRLRDLKPLPHTEPPQEVLPSASSHKKPFVAPEKPDCVFLLALGERGIDGHPNVAHGGVVCAILDETMGYMAMFHHDSMLSDGTRDLIFTANLNVNYRRPVPTPNNVIVKAWMTKREQKKWRSRGQIVDMDGNVLAEAEALFVVLKSKL